MSPAARTAMATARVASSPGPLDALARMLVWRRLAALREGHLTIEDADSVRAFGAGLDLPPASLRVIDPRFYRRAVVAGSLGFAESYLRGEWTARDLTAVLRVFARNVARHGAGRWAHSAALGLPARIGHALRANTRRGSRSNIRAHYDLGNDFYALFLDPTLTYSCAVFDRDSDTLEAASRRKLDLVCRKLDLRPGQRVLEIGGGWGSFALHAAREYGVRVTTTTISPAQRSLARARVRDAGLADRVDVLDTDYRDLTGTFDRVVSIEMIEAVGHARLPGFFRACTERLSPDGAMLLQAITMPDRDYDAYRGTTDFIQRYVFPGSHLPSLGAIARAVGAATDLRIQHVESFGPHYAETLRRWRAAFTARLPEVRALGFDERFLRLWTYYLCYCEAGFDEDYVDVRQVLLARPAWRAAPVRSEAGTA